MGEPFYDVSFIFNRFVIFCIFMNYKLNIKIKLMMHNCCETISVLIVESITCFTKCTFALVKQTQLLNLQIFLNFDWRRF